MHDLKPRLRAVLGTVTVVALLTGPGIASAQKIVCWKDKAGKVIGCGDKVPPEYQSSATKELDSRGVTRRTTESSDEATQRRQRDDDAAKVRVEEDRKAIDQKRQDNALLATFSSDKEIDLKRDRDLQVLEGQLEQLTNGLKSTTQRYNDVRARVDTVEKNKKPIGPQLKSELDRATADKQRMEHGIEAKQKEKEELRERFAAYKKRYNELRAGAVPGSAPAQAASASAKK
jgi:chromosome segregation ATPase